MKKEESVVRNLLWGFCGLMAVMMVIHFYLMTKEDPKVYAGIVAIFSEAGRPK